MFRTSSILCLNVVATNPVSVYCRLWLNLNDKQRRSFLAGIAVYRWASISKYQNWFNLSVISEWPVACDQQESHRKLGSIWLKSNMGHHESVIICHWFLTFSAPERKTKNIERKTNRVKDRKKTQYPNKGPYPSYTSEQSITITT
jgi:hypothetical protein